MSIDRRSFIKASTTLASGIAFTNFYPGIACNKLVTYPFGLQLYTLRDIMPKDPKGILREVSTYGYEQIESYEHAALGMFWGMTPTDFKKYSEGLGLKIIGSHCDVTKELERKAASAATIGMRYLICPWVGPQKSLDDFKRTANAFNQYGEICRKNGIRFAYHNHDYSFHILDGQIPQDILITETDDALVDFEMDIYWVVSAGQDPLAWIKKYPNRFKLLHVKDRMKGVDLSNKDASVTLGEGSINFSEILHESKALKSEYFIVEQERYEGTTPLNAVKQGAQYMRSLNL